MWKNQFKNPIIVFIIASLLSQAYSAPAEDLVPELRDMAKFDTFKLYSGYLPIGTTTKSLHYIFVESQSKPTTDPVIVWFNGGPGCSSVLGFAQEHGPYVMEDGTTQFVQNEYSWNKEANMLYIESPAGVGYSMCQGNDCRFTDETSADDNLVAILYFFEQKFPEYQTNDLYISGESYAGIYVPYVSQRIDTYNFQHKGDANFKPNLKGFIVGNGCTNWDYDCDVAYYDMAYWHGLIDDKLYQTIIDNNCLQEYSPNSRDSTRICTEAYYKMEHITKDINIYDVYGKCYTASELSQQMKLQDDIEQIQTYSNKDYTPFLYRNRKQQENHNLQEVPPCIYGAPLVTYFRDAQIKQQLHIPETYTELWDICTDNTDFFYASNYATGSQWVYESFQGKYKMLFYSGDTDGAVPTRGSMNWISMLRWKVNDPWRAYMVDGQVGGYVESYEGGLTFATINGAGHMAPQWKRPQTYYAIFNWVKNLPL